MSRRLNRTYIRLPDELVADLHEVSERTGITVAALACHWWLQAVKLAIEDPFRARQALPQKEKLDFGGSRGAIVRWSQSRAHFDLCNEVVRSVGSTPGAVIEAAVKECRRANYNVLTMNWPPKSDVLVAA